MQAGLLRHTILFQKPEFIKDEFGSNSLVWNDFKTTRASAKINEAGGRTNENNEIIYAYSVRFSIRYFHEDIDEKMRIIWKNRKYRIIGIFPDHEIQRIVIDTELINE